MTISASSAPIARASGKKRFLHAALRHANFVIGATIIMAFIVLAVSAPYLTSHDPFSQNLVNRLKPPFWSEGGSLAWPLGTDHLGRDYFSRLLYGCRISLVVGFGAATLGAIIGVTLGVCAAYFGRGIDAAIGYLLSCQLALPNMVLAMTLVFLIGPSVSVVIAVIGFLHWNYFLVVSRSVSMQIARLEYVQASRAAGSSSFQVIRYDILPNIVQHIIVIFTLEVGLAILAEASLSFLGVGIPSPMPSWGLMIAEAKNSIFTSPWLIVLPGVLLFTLVVATNLVGDALRDLISPESIR